jgi:hypothetical protein
VVWCWSRGTRFFSEALVLKKKKLPTKKKKKKKKKKFLKKKLRVGIKNKGW